MPAETNVLGMTFGKLTILDNAVGNISSNRLRKRILCSCECGNIKTYDKSHVIRGHVKSCGCIKKEIAIKNLPPPGPYAKKHGHFSQGKMTPTYHSWNNAKTRCFNSSRDNWKAYGGRGIIMCDRWKDSFEAFFSDMGERPYGTTLDRINTNGNYEPGNCRWATDEVQRLNKRNGGVSSALL